MIPHNIDESPIESPERDSGKYAGGLMARLSHHHGSEAWRETVTRHVPESWPAARLALQARIAALDLAQDETILDLTRDEAA
ncbi:MAG TPA: hypothetical protein VFI85_06645 [Methyloceanibacter sp.]|nr:hypothetical protein [Methyloceanibacter sp.]